jgi:hypothetical protein
MITAFDHASHPTQAGNAAMLCTPFSLMREDGDRLA